MPTKYRFETDGDFVNFYDDDSLVLRLHNSSRHVQWNIKDDTGIYFNIDELRYQIELSTISFDGSGISEQGQFETKIIELFPGLAGGGGGGGTTPTLDQVLSADNDADGKQIINLDDPTGDQDAATKKYVDDNVSAGYLVYSALISQVGTADPTVVILGDNTIGDIVWARLNVGIYTGTLIGAFPENQTGVLAPNVNGFFFGSRTSDDAVLFFSKSIAGSQEDDVLSKDFLEIRVYPSGGD